MSTRSSPTGKSKPTKKSTEKSTEKSTSKVYQAGQHATEAAYRERTYELAGCSPKRTSKDDCFVKQHLQVNAEYQ